MIVVPGALDACIDPGARSAAGPFGALSPASLPPSEVTLEG